MKKVLIVGEYSATVREAFKKKGHNAWSCDILPSEVPGKHIQKDARLVINDGWDLMIAHPPCTFLARSGAHWLNRQPGRWEKMQDAVQFFMDLYSAPINEKALEQPNPFLGAGLPLSSQRIDPFLFGDPFRKSIHLWLINLPPLMATVQETKFKNYVEMHRSPKERSRFFPGVADAFAEQWGNL